MRPALAAFAALAFAAPAGAADIQNVRSLDLGVRGEIAQQCSMGAISDVDFGDLNRPGLNAAARVQLNCNIPFNMTIKAQNGGLANSAYPNGQGPYSGTLPYRIAIAMPVRRPGTSLVERNFESRDLMGAGRTISTDGAIAVDNMALRVSLGRPSGEAGLLAGNYSETIEITIAPS